RTEISSAYRVSPSILVLSVGHLQSARESSFELQHPVRPHWRRDPFQGETWTRLDWPTYGPTRSPGVSRGPRTTRTPETFGHSAGPGRRHVDTSAPLQGNPAVHLCRRRR